MRRGQRSGETTGDSGNTDAQAALIAPAGNQGTLTGIEPEAVEDATETGGYEWEKFEISRYVASQEPRATIQRKGTLSLNKRAYDGLGNARSVELWYDRKRGAIGVRPAPGGTDDAYPLRLRASTAG